MNRWLGTAAGEQADAARRWAATHGGRVVRGPDTAGRFIFRKGRRAITVRMARGDWWRGGWLLFDKGRVR